MRLRNAFSAFYVSTLSLPVLAEDVCCEQSGAVAAVSAIKLQVGKGRKLGEARSDLGAEVEWGDDKYAEYMIDGTYRGSRDAIAQELLKDSNFAIFHSNARLHVIVLHRSRTAVTDTQSVSQTQINQGDVRNVLWRRPGG